MVSLIPFPYYDFVANYVIIIIGLVSWIRDNKGLYNGIRDPSHLVTMHQAPDAS